MNTRCKPRRGTKRWDSIHTYVNSDVAFSPYFLQVNIYLLFFDFVSDNTMVSMSRSSRILSVSIDMKKFCLQGALQRRVAVQEQAFHASCENLANRRRIGVESMIDGEATTRSCSLRLPMLQWNFYRIIIFHRTMATKKGRKKPGIRPGNPLQQQAQVSVYTQKLT